MILKSDLIVYKNIEFPKALEELEHRPNNNPWDVGRRELGADEQADSNW